MPDYDSVEVAKLQQIPRPKISGARWGAEMYAQVATIPSRSYLAGDRIRMFRLPWNAVPLFFVSGLRGQNNIAVDIGDADNAAVYVNSERMEAGRVAFARSDTATHDGYVWLRFDAAETSLSGQMICIYTLGGKEDT